MVYSRFIKLALLLFISINCYTTSHSQSYMISFQDQSQISLPYVTVVDTLNREYKMADNNGILEFETANSNALKISLIGYQDTFILAETLLDEDTNFITLRKNIEELEGVVVLANLDDLRKRTKSAGYFTRKGRDEFNFSSKSKFGILIDRYISNPNLKILKQINFRLVKPRNIRRGEDYQIEIKLYAYQNGKLSAQPINKEPIYFNFDKAKKKNSIDLEETIVLPKDGLFISFEFPDHPEGKTIRFGMTPSADPPKSYNSTHRYPNWENFNKDKYLFSEINMQIFAGPHRDKVYSNYKVGIEYDEYEMKD